MACISSYSKTPVPDPLSYFCLSPPDINPTLSLFYTLIYLVGAVTFLCRAIYLVTSLVPEPQRKASSSLCKAVAVMKAIQLQKPCQSRYWSQCAGLWIIRSRQHIQPMPTWRTLSDNDDGNGVLAHLVELNMKYFAVFNCILLCSKFKSHCVHLCCSLNQCWLNSNQLSTEGDLNYFTLFFSKSKALYLF